MNALSGIFEPACTFSVNGAIQIKYLPLLLAFNNSFYSLNVTIATNGGVLVLGGFEGFEDPFPFG